MYQRYGAATWTRAGRGCCSSSSLPLYALMDAEIKKGELNEKYDVIILPDDSHGRSPASARRRAGRRGARQEDASRRSTAAASARRASTRSRPSCRRAGRWSRSAGRGNFAIEKLGLPVRNVVAGKSREGVLVPGLHAQREVSTTRTRSATACRPRAWWSSWAAARRSRSCPATHNERYEIVGPLRRPRPARERLADRRTDRWPRRPPWSSAQLRRRAAWC